MDFAGLHARERQLLGSRPGTTGVAVSGGGIRSATFALGVFQAWAETGQLPRIDYLSTVSGGGYFGAFLGRLFARDYVQAADEVAWVLSGGTLPRPERARSEEQQRCLRGAAAHAVSWLRENGRYLAPRGSGDLLVLGAALFRNWLSVHVLLTLAGVTVFMGLRLGGAGVRAFGLDGLLARGAPPAAAAVVVLCLVWAYWLVWPQSRRRWTPVLLAVAAGVVVGAARLEGWNPAGRTIEVVAIGAAVVATGTGLSVWLSGWWLGRVTGRAERLSRMRTRLASALKSALVGFAAAVVVIGIDGAALWLYRSLQDAGRLRALIAAIPAVVAGVGAFARQIAVLTSRPRDQHARLGWMMASLAWVAAAVLALLLLIGYSLLSYALLQRFGALPAPGVRDALLWFAALAVMLIALGRSQAFVNQSTHLPLYAARLGRAYLGASNESRWSDTPRSPLEPAAGDDVSMDDYWGGAATWAAKGAPLHIVNVTINETFGGKSQVQQQDRHGLAMAVGPGGISVGRRHHVAFAESPDRERASGSRLCYAEPGQASQGFDVFAYDAPRRAAETGEARPFLGERLPLSQWVGISGAAFSTGLGSRTNIGLSLLAGLFNVRLGHWWDSGVDPAKRTCVVRGRWLSRALGGAFHRLLPLYYYLCSELVARFPGVARRRWYLSDGGHFENMGAYELIRRRLPLVVILDGEADPNMQFGGLANLVRKARIDFDTQIDFATALDGLCRSKTPCGFDEALSTAHVAVASVTYPARDDRPAERGTLVYVKASLTGDEDADLMEYARSHPAFPHESTADQFFDEAQWESYRRLGYHIGRGVSLSGST
jgi:hypothetical protein